jgi:hypothetical protein
MAHGSVQCFGGAGSQARAFACARVSEELVRVWSREVTDRGAREFYVGSVDAMQRAAARLPAPPLYEMVHADHGAFNMFVDAELPGARTPNGANDGAMREHAYAVARALVAHARAWLNAHRVECGVAEGSRGTKASFHLVARAWAYNGVPLALHSVEEVHAHVGRALHDEVLPPGFVDASVYKPDRNFRMAGCVKFGRPDSELRPLPGVRGALRDGAWCVSDVPPPPREQCARAMLVCAEDGAEVVDMPEELMRAVRARGGGGGRAWNDTVAPACLEPLVQCVAGAGAVRWRGYLRMQMLLIVSVHGVPCVIHNRVHKNNALRYHINMRDASVVQHCHNTSGHVRAVPVPDVERALAPLIPAAVHAVHALYAIPVSAFTGL